MLLFCLLSLKVKTSAGSSCLSFLHADLLSSPPLHWGENNSVKMCLDRSAAALRLLLVCQRLFEVVRHCGILLLIISPRLCLFLLLPRLLKWPRWFPGVNGESGGKERRSFLRLSDTSVTNGHVPLRDNASVWCGQGWAFGWWRGVVSTQMRICMGRLCFSSTHSVTLVQSFQHLHPSRCYLHLTLSSSRVSQSVWGDHRDLLHLCKSVIHCRLHPGWL